MAVIGPDGIPTESGSKILLAVQAGFGLPEDIARHTNLALLIVRTGLHDMEKARLVKRSEGRYILDERGISLLR